MDRNRPFPRVWRTCPSPFGGCPAHFFCTGDMKEALEILRCKINQVKFQQLNYVCCFLSGDLKDSSVFSLSFCNALKINKFKVIVIKISKFAYSKESSPSSLELESNRRFFGGTSDGIFEVLLKKLISQLAIKIFTFDKIKLAYFEDWTSDTQLDSLSSLELDISIFLFFIIPLKS